MLVLFFVYDVTALGGELDRRVLQIRQVLSRKRENRRCRGRSERDEIGGRSLVTISWTPERQIGNGAEMDCRFDRLVCGAIFTKTDRVVGRWVRQTVTDRRHHRTQTKDAHTDPNDSML